MDGVRAAVAESILQQLLATLQAMQSDIREIAAFAIESRERRDEAERVQADADLARRAQQERDNKARW